MVTEAGGEEGEGPRGGQIQHIIGIFEFRAKTAHREGGEEDGKSSHRSAFVSKRGIPFPLLVMVFSYFTSNKS